MLIRDYYDIEILLDGTPLKDPTAQFVFVLHDSIYDLYNRATLTMFDDLGLLQELLATIEGTPVEINYGLKLQNIIKPKYVVYSNSLRDMRSTQVVGGPQEIDLINSWYYDQGQSSVAYKDKISDVVRSLTNKANFTSRTINSTSNYNTWYQALKTEGEFIQSTLKKYASSLNSEDSPFYAFINSNNEFNFRNYYDMYNDKVVANLKYVPDEENNKDINVIRYLKPYSKGSQLTRPFKKRKIYNFDNSGDLQYEDKTILDYLPSSNDILMRGNKSTFTGFADIGEVKAEKGANESLEAESINELEKAMNLQKMLVICPYNPKLLSGKTVGIKMFTYGSKDQPLTQSQIGTTNWLIESSDHVWNGNETKGFSRLIVGRKYSGIGSNYYNKEKLFRG